MTHGAAIVPAAHPVTTVAGPDPLERDGVFDAHAHAWISPVAGAAPGGPRLDDAAAIEAELADFADRGGAGLIDCQPPGAGRDPERLVALAAATGLAVVAATGFHLPRYHADPTSPWRMDPDALLERLLAELTEGMRTPDGRRIAARAGVVKAAHPGRTDAGVRRMLEVAAEAAHRAGVLLVIHTERGEGVEDCVEFLLRLPMAARDVILCHTDKRPDPGLHRTLAQAGFLLEYDTFMRSKYAPDERLWPLLDAMVADGLGDAIACGLDAADRSLWRFGGDPHGARAWTDVILPEMRNRGYGEERIARLTGGSVRERLRGSGVTAVPA